MKSLVFDSSSIISLATNNLLWLLRPLKKQFKGDFYISKSIKHEIVDHPLTTKRFKFEALVIEDLIEEGYLKLHYDKQIEKETEKLVGISKKIFNAKGRDINLVQKAEVEGLLLAKHLKSEAFVVDERTMRLLVEAPENVRKILQSKLHTKIHFNGNNLNEFSKKVAGVKIIRSTELAGVAYDLKLLDKYITVNKVLKKNKRKILLEGVLWGLKLKGCSISPEEINEILRVRFG